MTQTDGGAEQSAPGESSLAARLQRSPAALTGLFVALVALTLAGGYVDNIDTRICFHSAQSFLHHGTFALVDPTPTEIRGLWSAQGVDGQWYSKFGIGVTLLLLPFTALGSLLGAVLPFPTAELEEFAAALSTPVFLGVGAWAAVRIALDELHVGARSAVIGALAWTFCTYQLSYSGSTYLETPLGVAAVLSVWAGLHARRTESWRHAALCGAFAGLVVAIKVAMIVFLPFLLLPLLTSDRGRLIRRGVAAGVPLALWAGALMIVNATRFGSPLSTGYVKFSTLFETPLHVGVGGYLFDPDLSLALFAPAFVVALVGLRTVFRRSPVLLWSALGVFVSGTIVHALHTGYHGGTVYGPRYLISAIPLLTFCGVAAAWDAAGRGGRLALEIALAISLAMQVPSALVSPNEYHSIGARARVEGPELRDLPPRVHYRLRPRLVVDAILFSLKLRGKTDVYELPVLIADPRFWPARAEYRVPPIDQGFHVWWLIAAREKTIWAIVPGVMLLGLSIGVGWMLRRAAPRASTPASSPPPAPPERT